MPTAKLADGIALIEINSYYPGRSTDRSPASGAMLDPTNLSRMPSSIARGEKTPSAKLSEREKRFKGLCKNVFTRTEHKIIAK